MADVEAIRILDAIYRRLLGDGWSALVAAVNGNGVLGGLSRVRTPGPARRHPLGEAA